MYFAAGAREVYFPFDGGQRCQEHDLETRIARGRIEPHRLPLSSVHPQGSCPAGAFARNSDVDPHAQVGGASGVYIADASIFPSSVAVPPQVTIMSLAQLVANHIADELGA